MTYDIPESPTPINDSNCVIRGPTDTDNFSNLNNPTENKRTLDKSSFDLKINSVAAIKNKFCFRDFITD